MDRVIEFSGNHLGLVAAFVALLVALLVTELRRKSLGARNIAPGEAIRLVNDNEAVMLDVREANEYKGGHIIDAVHIPLSKLKDRLTELDKYKSRPIVAYCRSGSRSMSACQSLKKAGFEQLFNLGGGVMAWQNASLPLTKQDKPVKDRAKKKKAPAKG